MKKKSEEKPWHHDGLTRPAFDAILTSLVVAAVFSDSLKERKAPMSNKLDNEARDYGHTKQQELIQKMGLDKEGMGFTLREALPEILAGAYKDGINSVASDEEPTMISPGVIPEKHWTETVPCIECKETAREGQHATEMGLGHEFEPATKLEQLTNCQLVELHTYTRDAFGYITRALMPFPIERLKVDLEKAGFTLIPTLDAPVLDRALDLQERYIFAHMKDSSQWVAGIAEALSNRLEALKKKPQV